MKGEHDDLIMRLITQEVLPRATELYMAGPLQVNSKQWASGGYCDTLSSAMTMPGLASAITTTCIGPAAWTRSHSWWYVYNYSSSWLCCWSPCNIRLYSVIKQTLQYQGVLIDFLPIFLQSLDSDEDDEGDGYQLVHGAAGLDPAELPGPVQALLAALRHNQAQINALQAEREQLKAKAKQQEVELRKQLAEQRRCGTCCGNLSGRGASVR